MDWEIKMEKYIQIDYQDTPNHSDLSRFFFPFWNTFIGNKVKPTHTFPEDQLFNLEFQFKSVFNLEYQT